MTDTETSENDINSGCRKTIRILHTADTHLGYRQYQSDIRHDDFFESFNKVIEDAVSMSVDAVIHAGDFFDSRNPSLDDLIRTIGILLKLKSAGIPFYGIVGNHEGKQSSQWLDLFESMKIAHRLSESPIILKNENVRISIYGIDNLSAPRLASYDFSLINEEIDKNKNENARDENARDENAGARNEISNSSVISKDFSLLVLHQLLTPVIPAQQLSAYDFLDRINNSFDAVLLGDNHIYECVQIPSHEYPDFEDIPETDSGKTWITYPGSTERCSAAENEPRSYNLIEFSESGLMITRRRIPTRPFVVISVQCGDEIQENAVSETESPAELLKRVFAAVDDYREKIKDAVVFAELLGSKNTVIPFAEVESYILNCGAVVAKVSDRRDSYSEETTIENIPYLDPDEVILRNLRRLNLTEAGFLADRIIRDPAIVKSRVDEETEERISQLIDEMSFEKSYKRDGPLVLPEDSEFCIDVTDYAKEKEAGNENGNKEAGNEINSENEDFDEDEYEDENPDENGSSGKKLSPEDFERFKRSVMESDIFKKTSSNRRSDGFMDFRGFLNETENDFAETEIENSAKKDENEKQESENGKKIHQFRLSDRF